MKTSNLNLTNRIFILLGIIILSSLHGLIFFFTFFFVGFIGMAFSSPSHNIYFVNTLLIIALLPCLSIPISFFSMLFYYFKKNYEPIFFIFLLPFFIFIWAIFVDVILIALFDRL